MIFFFTTDEKIEKKIQDNFEVKNKRQEILIKKEEVTKNKNAKDFVFVLFKKSFYSSPKKSQSKIKRIII